MKDYFNYNIRIINQLTILILEIKISFYSVILSLPLSVSVSFSVLLIINIKHLNAAFGSILAQSTEC